MKTINILNFTSAFCLYPSTKCEKQVPNLLQLANFLSACQQILI